MQTKSVALAMVMVSASIVGLIALPDSVSAGSDCEFGDNKLYTDGDVTICQDSDTGEKYEAGNKGSTDDKVSEDPHEDGAWHDPMRDEIYSEVLGNERLGTCIAKGTSPGSPSKEVTKEYISKISDRAGLGIFFYGIFDSCTDNPAKNRFALHYFI